MKRGLFVIIVTLTGAILFSLSGCKKKEPPILVTSPITDIQGTSVKTGGNITDDKGETILSRGVCWSTNIDPTVNDTKTSDGQGAGIFTSTILNMAPATTYYFRAYATNSNGTGYGMVLSCKTLGDTPATTALVATNVTTVSANLAANVNPNYLSTKVSFEYGTSTDYGNTIDAVQSPVTGSFLTLVNVSLSGLTAGTTYHYRVKAENTLGKTYGADLTFTTLGAVPTAVTSAATSITTISATFNGSVSSNYLSTVVTFEYGTTTAYGSSVDATQSPVNSSYSTTVSKNIATLSSGTTYHFRVKAVNILGTTYGNDLTFTTLGGIPTVVTLPVVFVTTTTAGFKGTVNPNLLLTTITFEYGATSSYGSTINGIPNTASGSSLLTVSATPTGLTEGTTYHYRIKAVNSVGTSYGDDVTFTPAASAPLSDVDGNVYATIQVGTQLWMAENLKTTKYSDGTSIPNETVPANWIALTTPAFRWYNDDAATYKNVYGALYNWFTVNTGKLCPDGWHVPSDNDFTVFTNYLGGLDNAGAKIKEAGYTHWTTPNAGATNETGFTALPAGYIDDSGNSAGVSLYEIWWSSTLEGKPWYRSCGYLVTLVSRSNGAFPQRGMSVRCLKN